MSELPMSTLRDYSHLATKPLRLDRGETSKLAYKHFKGSRLHALVEVLVLGNV